MATVSPSEGIKYGFGLHGYLFGLWLIARVSAILAVWMFTEQQFFIVLLIGLLGALIVITGLLGMTYEVIFDAVQNGVMSAN